jgi:hypothetical protein
MLLRDPYAGHRNFYTDEPDAPLNEWTQWDFALAMAVQFIKDGTTEEGHLIWEIEDERVVVEPIREINKARAATDAITSVKDYKAAPGEYWRTKLITPWHEEEVKQGFAEGEFKFQTRSEWIQSVMEEEAGLDEEPPVEL